MVSTRRLPSFRSLIAAVKWCCRREGVQAEPRRYLRCHWRVRALVSDRLSHCVCFCRDGLGNERLSWGEEKGVRWTWERKAVLERVIADENGFLEGLLGR